MAFPLGLLWMYPGELAKVAILALLFTKSNRIALQR